jgi:hypothetical protein
MEKFKNYLILALLISLGTVIYINYENEPVPDKVVITDEETGGVEKELAEVIPDTVFIEIEVPGKAKPQIKEIVVDSTYKSEYEKAIKDNDSLKAKNLFLESISLDTFEGNLIDNKDITIDGKFKTRGKLLEYKIDYKIKSDTLTFKPNIEYRHPKASFVYGVKLGLPMQNGVQLQPTLEGVVGFQNKKGNIITFSADTQKRFSIGYYKTITLFK